MEEIKRIFTFCILIFFVFFLCECKNNRTIFGRDFAKEELKNILNDITKYQFLEPQTCSITDSLAATTYAETILFGIFGKENITKQKPYEIYHLGNYWSLKGTLQKGWLGGTFLLIVDDRNSEVIKISHGK